jgi:hypothetical protein
VQAAVSSFAEFIFEGLYGVALGGSIALFFGKNFSYIFKTKYLSSFSIKCWSWREQLLFKAKLIN